MPKDATKNVDRYKIRGGSLNEFEFTENQEAFAEDKRKHDGKLIPGTPPEKAAKKATNKTAKKAANKASKKPAKKKASVSAQGASAKKLAARKAATKKAAKKK